MIFVAIYLYTGFTLAWSCVLFTDVKQQIKGHSLPLAFLLILLAWPVPVISRITEVISK